MDKFQEAICAFSNDLPNSRQKGYLLIGAYDDGTLSGLKVGDNLLKKISAIRSDGNILPLPVMSVDCVEFDEGDILVVEVSPSLVPPVRYRGRTFVRIGPRRDIASETEERILFERRASYMATFDATPCLSAKITDINTEYIHNEYLPMLIDEETLMADTRSIKEKMAAVHLYDIEHDCPTFAAVLLFGNNPRHFVPGAYIQYVHFAGDTNGSEIINERRFEGSLFEILPKIESFLRDALVTARPIPVSILREKTVFNYPFSALRELIMNACMHRDYQSNMPIRIYQYNDRIEMMNAGGLYGEARPENFPLVNDYRNPIIAEAMRAMKYVNMFNRGIQRVKEMFSSNGNPAPQWNVDKITVFEVIVRPNAEQSDYSNDTIKADVIKNETNVIKDVIKNLSERQIAICEMLIDNPTITAKMMANTLGIADRTVYREIAKIQETGVVITREGGRTYGRWTIQKK